MHSKCQHFVCLFFLSSSYNEGEKRCVKIPQVSGPEMAALGKREKRSVKLEQLQKLRAVCAFRLILVESVHTSGPPRVVQVVVLLCLGNQTALKGNADHYCPAAGAGPLHCL